MLCPSLTPSWLYFRQACSCFFFFDEKLQITKSGAFHYLARTEVIRNTLNPEWNILEIDVDHLYPPEQPEKKRESILRFEIISMSFRFEKCYNCRLEVMDDDGEGKVDPLVAGVYRLDQLVSVFF